MKFMLFFILGLLMTMGGVGGIENNPPEVSVLIPTLISCVGLCFMYISTTYLHTTYDYH